MEQGTVRVPELASQVPVKDKKGQIERNLKTKHVVLHSSVLQLKFPSAVHKLFPPAVHNFLPFQQQQVLAP